MTMMRRPINNAGNTSAFFKPDLPNGGAIVNWNNLKIPMSELETKSIIVITTLVVIVNAIMARTHPMVIDYKSTALLWNVVKTLPLL